MSNPFEDGIASLREYGWIQGELGSKKEGFCGVGACVWKARERLTSTPRITVERYRNIVKTVLMTLNSLTLGGIDFVEWNDHEAKDVDEVIGVLKLASEQWELEQENK